MRHGKKLNHLGRTNSHRKAMMANMACSLIMHKRINTTVAKAKALRTYVEPLITKSKNDTTHSRRTVFAYLKQKEAVAALFREVGVKVATRAGGYTRILKTGTRLGDNAEMCMIELVDFNEFIQDTPKAAPVKKATRRSRGTKKEDGTADAATSSDDTASEEKPKRAPRAKKKDDTQE
jgi:large subunit ribosomal protein L17